jgi:[acyl-carrier-protein] S-malonyltransferase
MSTALVLLCPGQGAQAVGMGRAWFEASPEARSVFERADRLLGDRLGAPLSRLCFEGPAETLNRTDVSQPAIYTTSVASWAGLAARSEFGQGEAPFLATAGLSLGEYTALHLAGAMSFEDALELVTLRGRAMQDAAEASPSGMVALIGADEAAANQVCQESLTGGNPGEVLVPANFNAPGQIVISGSKAACERAVKVAADKGLRATALPVAGAFHSPLMAPAADRLRTALAGTPIREPRCPVMSNVTALPHTPGPGPGGGAAAGGGFDTMADSIRRRLVEQLTSPVRWAQGCQWLLENVTGGPGGNPAAELHELAPGKSLAGLMRRIDKSAKVVSHDAPDGG